MVITMVITQYAATALIETMKAVLYVDAEKIFVMSWRAISYAFLDIN